jgi:WD40 repeat protein
MLSPESNMTLSASEDSTARLWNLLNGQPIGSPLQHTHPVECVSFQTDGRQPATGCRDNNAYTWDIYAIFEEAGLSEHPNVS